jgi:hypothetical protein
VSAGDQLATSGMTDGKAHVWFPASSPYVLGCGGTAVTLAGSAVVSESVWHDGAIGTGGGISEYYPTPDFQIGVGLPRSVNDGHEGRGVPDVAALAANMPGYRIVVIWRASDQRVVVQFTRRMLLRESPVLSCRRGPAPIFFLDCSQIGEDGVDVLDFEAEFRHVRVARRQAFSQSFRQVLDRIALPKDAEGRCFRMCAVPGPPDRMTPGTIGRQQSLTTALDRGLILCRRCGDQHEHEHGGEEWQVGSAAHMIS